MSEAATMELAPGGKPAKHPVDQVPPPGRLLILGLQHLFIMYAGAVAVPLIVGPAVGLDSSDIALLVSADLLVSGIASVLQSVGISKIIGVRMPVVAGATFTVLNPMIIIANSYGGRSGLAVVYGALLCSGVFGLIIAKPFSMVLRFFPPLVTGTVIAMIGLSLIGADIGPDRRADLDHYRLLHRLADGPDEVHRGRILEMVRHLPAVPLRPS